MWRYISEAASIALGALILTLNILYLTPAYPFLEPLINVAGGLIAVVPSVWIFYARYRRKQQIEEQFILFISDLTQSINSGMTLPIALEQISRRNYLSLSPHVNQLAARVDWGVPFEEGLKVFAQKLQSVTVNRAVSTVVETYKAGGKLSDTLRAISESLITIDKIKKERSASVHSQIITSYLIYFVFILILVILNTFLIPALIPAQQVSVTGISTGATEGASRFSELFKESFVNFIIIQGFFAGLATGKMAEGSVVAGIKHSILLIAIGYTVFSFASHFSFSLF